MLKNIKTYQKRFLVLVLTSLILALSINTIKVLAATEESDDPFIVETNTVLTSSGADVTVSYRLKSGLSNLIELNNISYAGVTYSDVSSNGSFVYNVPVNSTYEVTFTYLDKRPVVVSEPATLEVDPSEPAPEIDPSESTPEIDPSEPTPELIPSEPALGTETNVAIPNQEETSEIVSEDLFSRSNDSTAQFLSSSSRVRTQTFSFTVDTIDRLSINLSNNVVEHEISTDNFVSYEELSFTVIPSEGVTLTSVTGPETTTSEKDSTTGSISGTYTATTKGQYNFTVSYLDAAVEKTHNFTISTQHESVGESVIQGTGINYQLQNNEASLIDYHGVGGRFTVPAEINGIPVTSIGANAFSGGGITSLIIPQTKLDVGEFAFAYNQITDITINNKASVMTLSSPLTTETPEIKFGKNAFHDNKVIRVSIETDSDVSLGNNTFTRNDEIITDFSVSANNIEFPGFFGPLSNASTGARRTIRNLNLKAANKLTISSPVGFTFSQIDFAGNVTLEAKEMTINSSSFSDATFASGVTFNKPASLNSEDCSIRFVGQSFINSNITTLDLSDFSTVYFGSSSFKETPLVDIIFKDESDLTFDSGAFAITPYADNDTFSITGAKSINLLKNPYDTSDTITTTYPENLILEATEKIEIADQVFAYRISSTNGRRKLLTLSITAPEIKIGANTFANNDLEKPTIDGTNVEFGRFAFRNNLINSFDNIVGSESLTIGNQAFINSAITDLDLAMSENVTIGNAAFATYTLNSFGVPQGNPILDDTLQSIEFHPSGNLIIGDDAFTKKSAITDLSITSTSLAVGARAFESNSLTTLTLPKGLTSLGAKAFANNVLTEVNLPSGITSAANDVFVDNENLEKITIDEYESKSNIAETSPWGAPFDASNEAKAVWNRIIVTPPVQSSTEYYYTGSEQTFDLLETAEYSVVNNSNKRTQPGSQKVEYQLSNKTDMRWNDTMTTENRYLDFTIISVSTGGGGGGGGSRLHTVTFVTNGGSPVSPITSILSGRAVSLDATTTRDGYEFIGWYTNSDLTGSAVTSLTVSRNRTVYAKWEKLPEVVEPIEPTNPETTNPEPVTPEIKPEPVNPEIKPEPEVERPEFGSDDNCVIYPTLFALTGALLLLLIIKRRKNQKEEETLENVR